MSIMHGKIPMAIIMSYISNKGSKVKRLSNACWSRNNEFLKNLLMGYLEGDGCHDERNHRWRLGFCENDKLAQDIRTLCARLGISLRLKRGLVSATKGGKMHRVWRGQIRFDQIDRSINDTCFKHAEDTEIISISKAKSQHFYDIGVEDEPHLFALASGVLTHNSLPSSVADRPCSSIEHVFLFSKSGDTKFWTHPTKCGTRNQPEPDYVYTNRATGEITQSPPQDWKEIMYVKEGETKKSNLWKRRNLWDGHDYFYDHVATMQPSSESYNKDKRPRGKLRQTVNPNSKYPDEGQFKKQDGTGNPTITGFNARYEDNGTGLRFMRDSDFFFKTWQGLMHNEDGEPMALVVNPRGYKSAHFAAFPLNLVTPLILAGSSSYGTCKTCGAPWVRNTVKESYITRPSFGNDNQKQKLEPGIAQGLERTGGHVASSIETISWGPSCECVDNSPIPAVVLDPFSGSAATGAACKLYNRTYVGIELNPEYCKLGEQRIKEGK